jgi:hypothetical protein
MADTGPAPTAKPQKDRSPSYPFIPLETALQRLAAFEQTFGRHPTPAGKVGLAWGMKEESSQAGQVLAALKAFGLVKYEGAAAARTASLTDDARNYLRAQQDSIRRDIAARLALEPKLIAQFWKIWGQRRPIDAVCLDDLVIKHAFTDSSARNFLRVYDATIAFAGLTDSDTVVEPDPEGIVGDPPPPPAAKVGDLVLVEVDGALVLKEPKRVEAIQEHDGQDWVFLKGEKTGILMSQVLVQAEGEARRVTPPIRALPPADEDDAALPEGWSEERLIDDSGDEIKIRYRGKAGVERYEFIRDYLDFKINRLKPMKASKSGSTNLED